MKEGTRHVNMMLFVHSVHDLDSLVFLLSKLCDDPQVCVAFVTSSLWQLRACCWFDMQLLSVSVKNLL